MIKNPFDHTMRLSDLTVHDFRSILREEFQTLTEGVQRTMTEDNTPVVAALQDMSDKFDAVVAFAQKAQGSSDAAVAQEATDVLALITPVQQHFDTVAGALNIPAPTPAAPAAPETPAAPVTQ